jgi:NAD+ synthase (glutamine-hydrolysing)
MADALLRLVSPTPFVPAVEEEQAHRCREIFALQTTALAKRLRHTGCRAAVLGVSGGLDSTLALLVTIKAFDMLRLPRQGVTAITMPGFGTTARTRGNAEKLAALLQVNLRTIPIDDAVRGHFRDIGHDGSVHDLTFENAQARERTQILMDVANQSGGMVIGTGDLSELALGWCTYNADHMSMYGVNAGVPKTLVRYLVGWCADNEFSGEAAAVLQDIVATPFSPELLPPDENGEIRQLTEEQIGPYVVHDFFLYHVVRLHFPPAKVLFLAGLAFAGHYAEPQLRTWLLLFYRRFFSQQFKRSCLPDGPKIGSVVLSPRGDWRMPSDASVALWLAQLE